MKLFVTKKRYQADVEKAVKADRLVFMYSAAHNAAAEALRGYVAYRTLSWWRKAIDEAENNGTRYLSLAEAFLKVQSENQR